MQRTEMYNRLIYSPTKNPYILFNGEKLHFTSLDFMAFEEKKYGITQVVEANGKAYSVYFLAPVMKGVRRE